MISLVLLYHNLSINCIGNLTHSPAGRKWTVLVGGVLHRLLSLLELLVSALCLGGSCCPPVSFRPPRCGKNESLSQQLASVIASITRDSTGDPPPNLYTVTSLPLHPFMGIFAGNLLERLVRIKI